MAISKETNLKIEEMQGQGFSYSQIAKTLNISKGYISKLMGGSVSEKQDLNEISNNESFTNRSRIVHNNDLNDNKEFLNEQLQTFKEQIRQELDNLKSEITQFIREEAPLKVDLDNVKQENKSLKNKLEFIKKVLKELNPNIYQKVIKAVVKK